MKFQNTIRLGMLTALCGTFLLSAAHAQENRDAVEAATEGVEVQQDIHPMLRLEGPYEATWESLDKHPTPQWFLDAKVGYSMHWGPYAVPAWAARNSGIGPDSYSEWYMNRMYQGNTATKRYHDETYGADFHYDEFIREFTAENFNADEWMSKLAENGVKYFFITSKHHDGFCLWDTKYTNRNSVKMGPKRDILRELTDAARKYGVKIGFYYSYYEWYNPIYLREFHGKSWLGSREEQLKRVEDFNMPYTGLIEHESYVDDFMIPQIVELIDNFQPDYLCFDGEWDYPESYWKSKQIAAYYYNQAAKRGQKVLMNDRFGKGTRGKRGDFFHVEYHANVNRSMPWAMWRGFGKSFGHNLNEDPNAFLSEEETIKMVVDCVSGNGNIEFNVGPTKDGRIDTPEWKLTLAMGRWLKINGEAIYDTKANPLKDFRSGKATYKPSENMLYLHVYDWPKNGILELPGVTNKIISARLLSEPNKPLRTKRVETTLTRIEVPHHQSDPYVSVVAVRYKGKLDVQPHVSTQYSYGDGGFTLAARDAQLTGKTIRMEGDNNIGFWSNINEFASWKLQVEKGGRYELIIEASAPAGGQAYGIFVNDQQVAQSTVDRTGGWGTYRDQAKLEIELAKGIVKLDVRKLDSDGQPVMNLKTVKLKRL